MQKVACNLNVQLKLYDALSDHIRKVHQVAVSGPDMAVFHRTILQPDSKKGYNI